MKITFEIEEPKFRTRDVVRVVNRDGKLGEDGPVVLSSVSTTVTNAVDGVVRTVHTSYIYGLVDKHGFTKDWVEREMIGSHVELHQ